MTSLTDLLGDEYAPKGGAPEDAYQAVREQAKEDPDFALTIAIPMLLRDDAPKHRRTILGRQLRRVEQRIARRARTVRQHAARLRGTGQKSQPRSRERRAARSRARSRSPDDGGDGSGSSRRSRRGRSRRGWSA